MAGRVHAEGGQGQCGHGEGGEGLLALQVATVAMLIKAMFKVYMLWYGEVILMLIFLN